MKVFNYIILFSFLVVSIVGFSNFAHADHVSHHSCVFNLSDNCATLADPINGTLEHLSSLKNSIQANIVQFFASAFILLSLLIFSAFILDNEKLRISQFRRHFKHQLFSDLFKFKIKFLAWLSVINKREPLALFLAR